ncbi:cytochrome bc1 complex Rieske iron-sulfur subunit [Actinotalea fermentans]|uniref:Cytochrome bc1 complex Rieske iron-sulfur subunit n=1 Tax=Actinotalea fermentans TaxID=43671 RepID=A0A511YU06_9CELL|nr:Rieske 2Fe-2S domain-containing protein [Actinotalea fermentans]KGM17275.1 ubiquinol-cytochrome C reductase [Actinotalea fermentans ATCC 43279 = JCM 9966 = DSM 3133]GEN78677.1 ubiquinol-cytochrome c reductase [Actinotalea fermentans]
MSTEHSQSTELTAAATHRDVAGPLPERFENPGLEPHRPRLTDEDPGAARRATRQVAALFGVSVLGTIGVIVAHVAFPPGDSVASMRTSNLLLGAALFLSLIGIGTAAVHWAKTLMSDHEVVEARHPQKSSPEVREGAIAVLREGAEDSGIARRGVLKGAMISALALFPLGLAVPLIGEVGGDWNVGAFRHTMWKRGTRLTRDPSGTPIKAEDVTVGSAFHVIPDGLREQEHWIEEKAKAVVLMVRLDPADLKSEQGEGWSYDGIVAFSKICTHVGCPVALYEQQTHHLLCPCHQSTFDIADGARVVFGPASRPLPQLPITVDDEGYLVAQSDFHEPIGPSYWERLK